MNLGEDPCVGPVLCGQAGWMVTVVHVHYVLFVGAVSHWEAPSNASHSMYTAIRKTLVCPHLLAAAPGGVYASYILGAACL